MSKRDEARLKAAFSAFEQRGFTRSERLFRTVLARDPASEAARHGLGLALSHLGKYGEARACYETLLRQARARKDAKRAHISLHQLGMVERLAGRPHAARARFEAEEKLIATHFPDDALARSANAYEFGMLALAAGEFGEAEGRLRESLGAASVAGDAMCEACAHRGLGDVAATSGRPEEARAAYLMSADAFLAAGDDTGRREALTRLAGL